MLTELFLAWRYFKPKRNAVSVITLISVIGVSLGVCVLMVVLAIMTGFTDEMKEKLLETSAHIQIRDYIHGHIAKPDKMLEQLRALGVEATPMLDSPVLVQKGDIALPKVVVGVDPRQERKDNIIARSIEGGRYSLEQGETVISYVLARQLGAKVGDKIVIHSPEKLKKTIQLQKDGSVRKGKPEEVYLPDEFKVSGIYDVGKYDFDKEILFVNLDDADELFGLPWGAARMINVRVANPLDIEPLALKVRQLFPDHRTLTWKQLNGQWLGVLQVEKNMMFFVLIFIVLVASSSITNTLITIVVQKTREIGLLKALGASSGSVMRIFIIQGFLVGFIGVGAGMALGLAVVHWRMAILRALSKLFGLEIFPKEFYFFSELPAAVVGTDLLFIGLATLVLCTAGALIPALRAARLRPAESLRYE